MALPLFTKNVSRSKFADFDVPDGSVLLFAESNGFGGSKLIAKNPDGSFSEVGASKLPIKSSDGSNIAMTGDCITCVSLTSGMVIGVDSSGLTSSVCVTQELWLDMPSTAVSFTLPAFTWTNGAAPDFTSASTRYVVVARWNGTKFLANLAYTEALT